MTKEHYLLLGGDEPISWISVDRDHLLEFFHKALQCTCVESVSIGMHMLLLVDESGRLKHREYNAVASRLYPGSFFNSQICGPAIVAFSGLVDGEPDWVPLPSFMLTALEDAIGLPIPPCPDGGDPDEK